MCKALKINRSSYYYKSVESATDTALENAAIKEFYLSRENYGTRKLQRELRKTKDWRCCFHVSRRKIRDIMSKYGLVSKYTLKRRKKHKNDVNNDKVPNIVDRQFSDRRPLEVVVSDLTYLRCAGRWHYICLLLDLHSRKIIGSAVGRKKDAKLVRNAFYGVQSDLRRINIFHTDYTEEKTMPKNLLKPDSC